MVAKYGFSDNVKKKVENALLIRNFTPNHFALHDRFHISDGLTGMGYQIDDFPYCIMICANTTILGEKNWACPS